MRTELLLTKKNISKIRIVTHKKNIKYIAMLPIEMNK